MCVNRKPAGGHAYAGYIMNTCIYIGVYDLLDIGTVSTCTYCAGTYSESIFVGVTNVDEKLSNYEQK